jgi:D-glycero-D-manno-heptose 1,7-bisphosphate phosphatase
MVADRAGTVPKGGRETRWVFLDRDGTLNVKPARGEYIEHPDQLKLLPGAARAVRMLNDAGLWTGVVTNQRGVALGRMSSEDLDAVHERLEQMLSLEGAAVDAIYACPHEIGACTCRKPLPGMLVQAKREHPGLDFERAAIVGDSPNDIEAGRRLGLVTVLLGETHDHRTLGADHVVSDLLHAAQMLLASQPRR